MELDVTFRLEDKGGRRGGSFRIPDNASLIVVEPHCTTLRVEIDNLPIAVFNDVIAWSRGDKVDILG